MSNSSFDSLTCYLNSLCEKDYDVNTLISVLKDLMNIFKVDNYKLILSSSNWNSIVSLSHIIKKILYKDSLINEELYLLAEYLRFLRNACGGGVSQNQQFIIKCNDILDVVKMTLNCFKHKTSDAEVTVLKCCIQLLGNLVCCNQEAKILVWNHFIEKMLFQCLLEHKCQTVREYTMMVLYNCMSNDAAGFLISTDDGHQILTTLLNSLCSDLVDWGILLLEVILKHEHFFQNCYEILPHQSRLLILDIILEQLDSEPGNPHGYIPISSINFIKELFMEYVMNIVQICNDESTDMKPVEIARLLGVLCNASVSDAYSIELKSSRSLLETLVDILKCVHLLGKKSSNAFSCISSLKILNKNDKEAIECNPSYGFKKNLIRLIGNLCFNCKDNQDAIRNLDGIPLLLDCCNLDARNPFIIQWGILAIRNIMEKNPENQAVLASISITGDLANSALIKEMGFEISNENGKFVLRSLQT